MLMKPKSKRTIRIVVTSVVFAFFFAGIVGVWFYVRLPNGRAEITGATIDNDYNNLLSGGNLVRIGDRIYFNYVRNEASYGLMEISESGSKRIYWEGKKSGPHRLSHRIRQHNDQLVMAFNDKIQYYSAEANSFKDYEPLNAVPNVTIFYQMIGQNLLYRQATDPKDLEVVLDGNLKLYSRNKQEIIAGPNIGAFYTVGNEIYYYNTESYVSGEFRKYNLIDQTDVSVCKLDGYYNMFYFIIEDNYLIFSASNQNTAGSPHSVYKVNLNSSPKRIETVCIGNPKVSDYCADIHSFNVYNGTIYISSHSGLTTYDVKTNENNRLCSKYTEECYIVDDVWVYFVDQESKLWRVAQDGSGLEKVFG